MLQADLLGNNERNLAVYLSLPDTRILRELVDPSENDKLLRTHLQVRENGFGVKGKNAATFYPINDIFDCLVMPDDDWVAFSSVPLASHHFEYRAERSFLVSMHLFLQHNSHIALGAQWLGSEKIIKDNLNRDKR